MRIHLKNHYSKKVHEYTGDIDSVKRQICADYPGFEEAHKHLPTSDFFQYVDSSHLASLDILEASDEEKDSLDELDEGWSLPQVHDTPQLDNSLNLGPGLKDIVVNDGDDDE